MKRMPEIGDTVTIHAALCEWDGVQGHIIGTSQLPSETMTNYMVERMNGDVWPFLWHELELHSLDDEEYGEP